MTPKTSPQPAGNVAAQWFSRVVWLGIVFNLLFIAQGLFAPAMVNIGIGLPAGLPTLWNQAHAMMVLALSIFYIPAAIAPLRNPGYSWLLVLSRALAAVFWASKLATIPGLLSFMMMDGAFAIAQGVLLQAAAPAPDKLFPTLGNLWTGIRTGVGAAFQKPAVRIGAVVAVILIAIVGYIAWDNLLRAEPDVVYASDQDHFKYGAIGLGSDSRVPYWIWKVLPEMFPEKLPGPGGWASLGLLYEPGHDLPVGFAKRHIGYDSVEANCALCHTGVLEMTAGGQQQLLLGAPAHTLDLQSFQRFLYSCAADPRFTADNVMTAIARQHKLGPIESAVYRYLLIPGAKEGLVEQQQAYAWQNSRPQQGRGRTDTFNPTKFNVFHMPDDGTIGTVDLPQIWNQKPRVDLYLHWDGNNNNIKERNFAAAMAIGATPQSVILSSFQRVTDFLLTLPPPKYPFPIDQSLANRGQAIFTQQCAACHAFGSARTGHVEDIAQIGTDRHRLDSFSANLVEKFHSINKPPFVFDAYRKTNGYSNVPIDGIWARAPYLHNGSVPTLWALLQAPQNRPAVFDRGCDLYDPKNVGFTCQGAPAGWTSFRLDTTAPGNGNQGHLYGTSLSDGDKWSLIEYLKTF